MPGGGEQAVYYWLCAAKVWEGAWDGAKELNAKVVARGPESFIERTRAYWKLWVGKEPTEFFGLPPSIVDLYKRSLLIVRTQIDEGGGIIAANDSDIMHFARDTYSYVWPRDGALVAHALDMAGYPRDRRCKFFHFCADVITPDGYLLHKYNPDESLASSWHPWVGRARRPARRPTSSSAAAAADPGGRDRAGGVGDVAPLPALPRHRRDEAALRPAGAARPPTSWSPIASRTPGCRRRRTICGRSGAAS